MNTLYITRGNRAVMLDQDNNPIDINSDREAISNVYLLNEDAKIISFDNDNNKIEKIGKAGDLVVSFYENEFPHRIIVVSNDEWRDNIETYNAAKQKREEEWAAKKVADACSDCGCCESC